MKLQKIKTKGKEKKIVFSSSSLFYDDCPICRIMKKAEEEERTPTEEELKKAFAEANTKNKN